MYRFLTIPLTAGYCNGSSFTIFGSTIYQIFKASGCLLIQDIYLRSAPPKLKRLSITSHDKTTAIRVGKLLIRFRIIVVDSKVQTIQWNLSVAPI